jgi:hypothetical protein
MNSPTTTTTAAATPLPPVFDPALATAIEPCRHPATGRTVAFLQAGEGEAMHLFSATGLYIGTGEIPPPAAP